MGEAAEGTALKVGHGREVGVGRNQFQIDLLVESLLNVRW